MVMEPADVPSPAADVDDATNPPAADAHVERAVETYRGQFAYKNINTATDEALAQVERLERRLCRVAGGYRPGQGR